MDRTIIILDQKELEATVDTPGRPAYAIRYAARAVVGDSDGRIALLHARQRGYYKLPGGGIDNDESILIALARELKEEIGSTANILDELGQVVEWRDWDKLKQVSYCFVAALSGEIGTPGFTDEEIAEGFEVVWASSIDQAIALVSEGVDSSDINVSFMTKRDKAILQAAKERTSVPLC